MRYEYRSYFAVEGKIEQVKRRFLDHTLRFFTRHGIEVVGIFEPEGSANELHYMTRFPDEETRKAAWAAFQADPEWQEVKTASEQAGPLLEKQSVNFLEPVGPACLLS